MKRMFLLVGLVSLPLTRLALADTPVLPPEPPDASKYEALWTKSPFAVATPDAVADSPEYALVGITQFDGIAYASIVEKQNSDHFLISSDKEIKGMTLKSITHSTAGSDTYANVLKDGQLLTLKLESMPLAPPPGAPPVPGAPGAPNITVPPMTQNITMPGSTPQNIAMPGSNPGDANLSPGASRFMRIHRPVIHLPPNPNQGQPPPAPTPAQPTGAAPAQGSAPPVQPHFPPPSGQ